MGHPSHCAKGPVRKVAGERWLSPLPKGTSLSRQVRDHVVFAGVVNDTPFGDDGFDVSGRGYVEGGVPDFDRGGCGRDASEGSDLFRAPLLYGDRLAGFQ